VWEVANMLEIESMWEQYKGEIIATDLDGILCEDDHPQIPLFLPPFPIDSIITGRHERHRAVTEKWLAKYKVQYTNLYMMKHISFDWQMIAYFKVETIKKTKATVFIESDVRQADYIYLECFK